MQRRILSTALVFSLLVLQVVVLPAASAQIGTDCTWAANGLGFGIFTVTQSCPASTTVSLPGNDTVDVSQTPTLIIVTGKPVNAATSDNSVYAGFDLGAGADSVTLQNVAGMQIFEVGPTGNTTAVHSVLTTSNTAPIGGTATSIDLGDGADTLDVTNSAALIFGPSPVGNNGNDFGIQTSTLSINADMGADNDTATFSNTSGISYSNGSLLGPFSNSSAQLTDANATVLNLNAGPGNDTTTVVSGSTIDYSALGTNFPGLFGSHNAQLNSITSNSTQIL